VYGIDMPSRKELIATGRTDEQICHEISADRIIYQDLDDLKAAVRQCNPNITKFDCSCFDGEYITGDITEEYLDRVEAARAGGKANKTPDDDQMELDLVMSASSM
jgi:amidophosphoribosyltransferase